MPACNITYMNSDGTQQSCNLKPISELGVCFLHASANLKTAVNTEFVAFLMKMIKLDSSVYDHDPVSSKICFCGAEFPASMDFNQIFSATKISVPIDFSGSKFEDNTSFANVVFGSKVAMSRCEFKGRVDFASANFLPEIVISNSNSMGAFVFNRSTKGKIRLIDCTFSGQFFANGAIFEDDVIVTSCKFEKEALFGKTVFQRSATFNRVFGVSSKGPTSFRNADFTGAVFEQFVNIESCEFHELTKFSGAKFNLPINGDKRPASFNGSVFHGDVLFDDSTFQRPLLLDGAEFKKSLNFKGSKFFKAPSLTATTFSDDVNFEKTSFDTGDEATFRKIKNLMEKQAHYWEATLFYRRELIETRKSASWLASEKWISWMYNLFNNYGTSWWRPLVWLAGMAIVLAIVYWLEDVFLVGDVKDFSGWQWEVLGYNRFSQAMIFSLHHSDMSWIFGKDILIPKSFFLAGHIRSAIRSEYHTCCYVYTYGSSSV